MCCRALGHPLSPFPPTFKKSVDDLKASTEVRQRELIELGPTLDKHRGDGTKWWLYIHWFYLTSWQVADSYCSTQHWKAHIRHHVRDFSTIPQTFPPFLKNKKKTLCESSLSCSLFKHTPCNVYCFWFLTDSSVCVCFTSSLFHQLGVGFYWPSFLHQFYLVSEQINPTGP